MANWLDKFEEGDAPKNYKSIPTGIIKPPKIVSTSQGSYYSPTEQTIYLNPKENYYDPSVYQHEMFHHWQNLNDQLRKPEEYLGPLAKPNMLANDTESYYNRRNVEAEKEYNDFYNENPTFKLVNPNLIYNAVVNPSLYENPKYAEGEAEEYQNYIRGGGTPAFMAKGGLIKRADGSYSRRGLWDNIRANRGSGRKPTPEMLRQERKINKHEDGSWVTNSSIPRPTTPSFYNAGADRTLTNYQMGTDKAPMYAMGSTVDCPCPPTCNCGGYTPATRSDSLAIYNNAIALNNFLASKGYQKIDTSKHINKSVEINQDNIDHPLKFLKDKNTKIYVKNAKQDLKNTLKLKAEIEDKKINSYVQNLQKTRTRYNNDLKKKDYTQRTIVNGEVVNNENPTLNDFYQPVNKYQFNQRENTYGTLNLDAPMPLYDIRITPQYYNLWNNSNLTDFVETYAYDPLAVKPADLRTPEEQEEWDKLYGDKSNTVDTNSKYRREANPNFSGSNSNSNWDALGNPRYKYWGPNDKGEQHVISEDEYYESLMDKKADGGPVMYNAGSTVWTKQNTPTWIAGTPTPTATQTFRNDRSLNTNRYTIGDVIPTGMNYKTPAAGTYDYNQDVQPYHTMRLHAPDTTMMARHGGHITNKYKERVGIPYAISPGVSDAGMYVGPTTQRGITFADGGWVNKYEEGSTVGGGETLPIDPRTGMPVKTLKEVEITADAPWYQYSQMFNLDNPDIPNKEAFVDQQKKKYLQYGDPGLLKGLGVTYENFPKEVEENYANQYDYLKNSYIMEKYAEANPYVDLESRGDWVEKLSPGYKNLLANSKYGSILQPNAWSRSLSGAQQLVNTFLPGKPLQYNIPGMTSSELKEANESNLSGLETLSFFPILGRNIANYGKNRGLSTGSNFKQLPGFFSGENMPNVNETEVMAFDPFSYAGLEAIPETIFNAGKGILNAPKFIKSKFAKLPKPASPTGVQLSQQEEALLQGTNIGKNVEKLNVDLGSTTQELPIDIFDDAAILDAYKLPEYQSITGLDYEDLIHLFNTDKDAFYKITEAHKAKYCAPGSPCAKSSNQITQSIWNKLKTGEPFDYNGNAADAWYSKDQITKNGGQTIYDSKIDGDLNNLKIEDLQIGDQVLMGPDGTTIYPKIDSKTGLIKEENVSHRATIVGVDKNGYPVILESGLGESLIPVPIHENYFYKNNSNYGIRSIVRPKQFIGAQDKIMNTLVKGSQIDAPTNIKFTATTDAAKAYKDIFEGTQLELSHTLNLNQDELIQVFRAVVGIGEQESKLGGLSNAPALTKAKIIVKDLLERKGLTPYVKDMANIIKKAGKTFFDAAYNPALDPFPGSAKVEMEAYKLVNSGKVSNLKEGIELLYNTKYNRPSKFILNTTKPSSGVFKQKEISPSGKLFGLRDNKKSIKDILNTPVTELLLKSTSKEAQLKGAMANFTDIMSKIKKNNPTWSNQKVFDMAIQSWNSPTKANSSELVDFFYHGIDNPNPQQIGFDYLTKVRRNMDTLLPITDVRKAATPSFRPVFTHKDGGYVQNNNSNAWLEQYN